VQEMVYLKQGFSTCGPRRDFWRATAWCVEIECVLQVEPLNQWSSIVFLYRDPLKQRTTTQRPPP